MSDTARFYDNTSPDEYLDKTITALVHDGTPIVKTINFLAPYNIDNPVIVLDYDPVISGQCNYIQLSGSGYYYYTETPVLLAGGRMSIGCHIDVRMTFKNLIRASSAIVTRNENQYNMYVPDDRLPLLAKPSHYSRRFSSQPLVGKNTPLRWYLGVGGGTV